MLRTGAGPKMFVGERVRRLREQQRISQGALARAIAVSPSYMSQIECDQRPLPRPVMHRLAEHLGVSLTVFEDSKLLRLAHDLHEASADPMFGERAVSLAEAHATIQAAPVVAERFLVLYRALRAHIEVSEPAGLATPPVSPSGSIYEEVRDWVQSHHNHFAGLDHAAEALVERENFDRKSLYEDLVRYLRNNHNITVGSDPALLGQGTVWKLNRATRSLALAEDASTESQVFWMCHIVAQLEQRREIERVLRRSPLLSREATALARVGLANYFAGALMMPYTRFLEEARSTRYDVARLQRRFGASFEQVCHRLSTMQRPGMPGLPFFFLKTDIAGNVLKRSSATRFQFSRFGGPCPLWNVYSAFARPGETLVQLAQTPDEVTYLNIARTVGRSDSAYLSRPRSVAVVLGCEIGYAPLTVYAVGLDLKNPAAAVPIGPGCRACERLDCRHRAVPPAGRTLDVGTGERGVVPYKISTANALHPDSPAPSSTAEDATSAIRPLPDQRRSER